MKNKIKSVSRRLQRGHLKFTKKGLLKRTKRGSWVSQTI